MAIIQMTILDSGIGYLNSINEGKIKGNYIVDWGDGTIEVNTPYHRYIQSGIYKITVKGDFEIVHLMLPRNTISLGKEEGCSVTDLNDCFYNCKNLVSVPHDWDLSKVHSMQEMFYGCKSFNQDLSHWDLSCKDTHCIFTYSSIEEKHKPKGIE